MKIENQEWQLVSLGLARKLRGLGVKQESLWYWCSSSTGYHLLQKCQFNKFRDNDYSAFTVAELGESLPLDIVTTKVLGDECRWLCSQYDSEDGDTIWHEMDEDFSPEGFYAGTEANARAKMLIYLLENKLTGKA